MTPRTFIHKMMLLTAVLVLLLAVANAFMMPNKTELHHHPNRRYMVPTTTTTPYPPDAAGASMNTPDTLPSDVHVLNTNTDTVEELSATANNTDTSSGHVTDYPRTSFIGLILWLLTAL